MEKYFVLMVRPMKQRTKNGKFLITERRNVTSLVFNGFRVASKKERKQIACIKDICKEKGK